MTLVLDASITLSWYFEDERTPVADGLMDRVVEQGACVPTLWRIEVANGLQACISRKRFESAVRDKALTQLTRMPITVDSDTETYAWSTTLHLAERFRLTLYDAAYLELAQRRHFPLATLDQPLRTAASALGVDLLGIMT